MSGHCKLYVTYCDDLQKIELIYNLLFAGLVIKQREDFNRLLKGIINNKNKNNTYMSDSMYKNILQDVYNAKLKKNQKTPLDYRRLQRYDIVTVGNEQKLVFPMIEEEVNSARFKYFVRTRELFDVIHQAHLSIGHMGRDRLTKELNEHYKNVTIESIVLYLSLCKVCQENPKRKKKVQPSNGI